MTRTPRAPLHASAGKACEPLARGGVKSIRGFRLRVFSESGNSLGTFDLGANADEGRVEGRTYYSSNGYLY